MKILKILFFLTFWLISLTVEGQNREQSEKLQKREQKHRHTYGGRENRNLHTVPRTRIIPYTPSFYYNPYNYVNPWNRWDLYYPAPIYPGASPRIYVNPSPRIYEDVPTSIVPSIRLPRNNTSFFAAGLNIPLRINPANVGFGIYMAGGRETFFLFSFDATGTNPYEYYPNISKYDVMRWNDAYVGRELEAYSYTFGGGRKVGDAYPYVALTLLDEKNYLVYFDETYILSNSGRYSITDDEKNKKYALTIGTMYRIGSLSLNASLNTRGALGAGFGFIL